MPTVTAQDGTELAYHLRGEGAPLICLSGGPMRDTVYFGDLGGLPRHLQLVLLDMRGTGKSAVPADPASYRCDRLVDDVEALRQHLGLDQIDLLGHSGGGAVAVLYATRYPHRISRLLLVTPSPRVVGLTQDEQARRSIIEARRDDPLHDQVFAAFERIAVDGGSDADWDALAPFSYGRWDEAAQAHCAAGQDQINADAADLFYAKGALDPAATRAALASFASPVLLLCGGFDLNFGPAAAAQYAALFADASLIVQPGGGHFPWLDDRGAFTAAVTGFLAATP